MKIFKFVQACKDDKSVFPEMRKELLYANATMKDWLALCERCRKKAKQSDVYYGKAHEYLSISTREVRGVFKGVGYIEFVRT